MKEYNFIIDGKLITVNAPDEEQGYILAQLTLIEMKIEVENLEVSKDLEVKE